MSDDEADPELLALLRESLGLGPPKPSPPSTGVLKDAEYICDNSIDIAISYPGTKAAAKSIWNMMKEKHYSTETWSEHELHPKTKDNSTINFIFTMNLLNFSFWSELPSEDRFAIEYKGKKWTGYWSLIAALQRALDKGHPITTPSFWTDRIECPDSLLAHIFRSATDEPIPLLDERIAILREAGVILTSSFDAQPLNLIIEANHSAAQLVNLLVAHFPNFNDTAIFHRKTVRLYKRAQIMVADLWACFNNQSPCDFHDISQLTTFPDYRIPQMLQSLGVLLYSPRLESKIRRKEMIESICVEEVEIRGCSVWGVEMVRREIVKLQDLERKKMRELGNGDLKELEVNGGDLQNGVEALNLTNQVCELGEDEEEEARKDQQLEAATAADSNREINAVLIDFFLYDLAKEREQAEEEPLPHHRTRSIYY